MTKLIPNNEILTKSDFFPCDIFKSDIIPFLIKKNIKVFRWLTKSKFRSLWLWEIRQSQTFIHGTCSNLTSSFIGCEILNYFNDGFYYWHLSISLQSQHKQVKWNQMKRDICKSDITFPHLQISTLNDFWNFWNLDTVYVKNDNSSEGKCPSFNFIL